MLSSANLLHRYRKFVVPVYHYLLLKANLFQYFFESELTHLKQICDNVFAMLIHWTIYLVSKYRQVIYLLQVEAALVECTVNKFVSIPSEPKMALTQLPTVHFLTSRCGVNVLRRSCFLPFLFRHACVTYRYDFMACITQSFGFC